MSGFNRLLTGGLYRSRHGLLLGVCRGFAEYFDLSVFWTRVIAFLLLVFTGFWPVGVIYFAAALLMKPEPVLPIDGSDEQEFYHSYVHSRKPAVDRLKRRYQDMERRIRRMEDAVTAREYRWSERIRRS